MDIRHGLLARVGGSPLLKLNRMAAAFPNVEIHAKAEWFNPGGSVKDRAALHIFRDAIEHGQLTPGGDRVLLDSSSGNTGIAYAMIGAVLGITVRLVVPKNISAERQGILLAYGTDLVFSDPHEGSEGSRVVAQEMAVRDATTAFVDQYSHPANIRAHYETTGPEIWEQTQGRVTHFLAGAGTGGTITGTTRYLKEKNPAIQCYAVQPDSPLHGFEGLKHMQSAHVPANYQPDQLDGVIEVSTDPSWDLIRRVAREEGYFVGFSSGAALAAALQLAASIDRGVIVTVFPDGGDKYLSSRIWEE